MVINLIESEIGRVRQENRIEEASDLQPRRELKTYPQQ
jgi:hypothetical protein